MKKNKKILIHCLAILGVLIYEQGIIYLFYGRLVTIELLYYLVDIPFFYLSVLIWYPATRDSRLLKAILYAFSFVILFLVLETGISIFIKFLKEIKLQIPITSAFYKRVFVRCVYITGISFAYFQAILGIRRAKYAREQELRIMEQERNRARLENAFLRSQINPHLLFNSLQFIEYQVQSNSQKAVKAVHLLSELMHYSLKATSESDTVTLKDELAYVQQYVELARLRSDNRSYLDLSINQKAAASNFQLPSGILGNLVENVFKHGDLSEPGDPAHVIIELEGEKLFVQTHNLKRPESIYRKTGIGMSNMRKRLDLLYPKRYTLRSTEEHNYYNLYFEILL